MGYIQRQKRQVEQFKKLETKKIPKDIDYDDVYSLRLEAKQKLKEYEPTSIGQASRISGVSRRISRFCWIISGKLTEGKEQEGLYGAENTSVSRE